MLFPCILIFKLYNFNKVYSFGGPRGYRQMKQNMCVTIDQNVHEWLKSKPEMMSRLVNGYLARAMMKEIKDNLDKEANIPQDRYCSVCDTTQFGIRSYCINKECKEFGAKIEVIE